jgi:DNA-binding response OmpR family regulator
MTLEASDIEIDGRDRQAPAAASAGRRGATASAGDAPSGQARWRVLLVDDDEDEHGLLCDMVEMAHLAIDLDWAGTYEEGLAALDHPAYDAYLVDYRLGEHSGLDLLKAARERSVAPPIILLTGAGNESVDHAALVAGAQDYLLKEQLNAEVLQRALRYAIEHSRVLEALREARDTLTEQVAARTAELADSNRQLQAELVEHRQAVEVAERERREKTALLESAAEGMYGVDTAGRCTFINRAGAAMLGYAPAEALGEKYARAGASPSPGWHPVHC